MTNPGADLSTVETLTVEGYEIRVSRTADGSAWQAVVTDADVDSGGSQMPSMLPMFQPTSGDDSDDADAVPEGPTVTAPHRWVAIGFAIEAYEFADIGEEPVSVGEAYEAAEIDGLELEMDTDRTPSWQSVGDNTISGTISFIPEDDDE